MTAIRLRKCPYLAKWFVLLAAVAIVAIADRMLFARSHDPENQSFSTVNDKPQYENLASVNRISARFSAFQQKFTQGNQQTIKQFTSNESRAELAADSHSDITNSKQRMSQLLADRETKRKDSNDDYLSYLTDVNSEDLMDLYVHRHKYEYIMKNENACTGRVLIVILVNSDPRKPKERMDIRNTWGSVNYYSGANIVTVFLLAQVKDDKIQEQITKESIAYSDIVQGNFTDSYRNLTYKSVMGLHWVQNFCNHTKFVLKVDDDTLVDPYHLVKFLYQKSPDGNLNNFLYCSTFRNQGPVRRTDDKWFVPNHEYPYSKYPPYCEGFAYIMSYDVTEKLYHTTSEVKFYWIDDVYVTGLVALKAGVTHSDMENGHAYNLMQSEHLSKNVQSSMFLLAKYEFLRQNWETAWNDIKSVHGM